MAYKHPPVDIIKLISTGHTDEWNSWLTTAYERQDLNKLIAWRYGMNLGMDLAHKQKLVDDKIVVIWIRMQKSIEITARKIIRAKYPFPTRKEDLRMHLEIKSKRDAEVRRFMMESSP